IGVVGDDGAGRAGGGQRFVCATGRRGDACRDGLVALRVRVVGSHGEGCAAGRALADRDGDRLAVGQGDDQRTASDRVVDRGRIDDGATFGHRVGGSGERDRGGVDRVGDGGGGSRGVHRQQDAAAGGAGDRGADGGRVHVDVVSRRKR